MIDLQFVINGDRILLSYDGSLRAARDEALKESGYTLRPFDDWEIRTTTGALLDPDERYPLLHRQTLILSLFAGMGAADHALNERTPAP